MKKRDHDQIIRQIETRHAGELRLQREKFERERQGYDEEIAMLRARITELEHAHTAAIATLRLARREVTP